MRRYDIDWLRVITIGLLLTYHIAIVFQPWGLMIGFIQSDEPLVDLWTPMAFLNVWRIPLLFFVSGMGVSFAIRKRNWKQLLVERTKRIWVPFVIGIFTVVPLHMYIWERHYDMPINYVPHMGHLWFLGNIFSYVLIFLPLFSWLKKHESGRLQSVISKITASPFGWLLMMSLFVLEVTLANPTVFEMYVQTWHGYFLGLLAFFFGFVFVYAGDPFLKNLLKWRLALLVVGLGLFLWRYLEFNLKSLNYLMSIESNVWVLTVLAFGYQYLQKPGKALSYLSEAAYPVYIWHMVFLYLSAYLILPLSIDSWVKFVAINLLTFAGCFAIYEIIKRVKVLRLAFGLKV